MNIDLDKSTKKSVMYAAAFILLPLAISFEYPFDAGTSILVGGGIASTLIFANEFPYGRLNNASTRTKMAVYAIPWIGIATATAAVLPYSNPNQPGQYPEAVLLSFALIAFTLTYISRTHKTGMEAVLTGCKLYSVLFVGFLVLFEIAVQVGVVSVSATGTPTTAGELALTGVGITGLAGILGSILAGIALLATSYRNRPSTPEQISKEI